MIWSNIFLSWPFSIQQNFGITILQNVGIAIQQNVELESNKKLYNKIFERIKYK